MIAVEVSKNPKQFDCATCAHHHCDLDGSRKNSRGPAAHNKWEIGNVIQSNVCLLPMITEFSRYCLSLYSHYKNGVLLRAGGLIDQPVKYVQAMGVIDGYINTPD